MSLSIFCRDHSGCTSVFMLGIQRVLTCATIDTLPMLASDNTSRRTTLCSDVQDEHIFLGQDLAALLPPVPDMCPYSRRWRDCILL